MPFAEYGGINPELDPELAMAMKQSLEVSQVTQNSCTLVCCIYALCFLTIVERAFQEEKSRKEQETQQLEREKQLRPPSEQPAPTLRTAAPDASG
jgi:hypothetical protein